MRVAILGASGALGMSTVAAARAAGHDVRVLARRPGATAWPDGVEAVAADAEDAASLRAGAAGCDALLHCVNAPIARWSTAVGPMLRNSIDACRAVGARLVFPGNVWVFGRGRPGDPIDESRPLSPCSKKGAIRAGLERAIAASGVPSTIVRLPEFYGPNVANALVGELFRRALAKKPPVWYGDGDAAVELVYIEDAAAALVRAGCAGGPSRTFHVPGGVTTPRAFLGGIVRAAGCAPRVRIVPAALVRAAGLVDPRARAFADILHLWTHPILLDGTRWRETFGAVPLTPYDEGIRRTLAWFAAHPDAKNAN